MRGALPLVSAVLVVTAASPSAAAGMCRSANIIGSPAAAASTQTGPDAPLDPVSAREIARGFIAAVNGGATDRAAWVERFVSPAGLRIRSDGEWTSIMAGIARTAETLRLHDIGQRGRWLDLRVEVGTTGRLREISVRRDRAALDQIVDVWAVQWPLNYPSFDAGRVSTPDSLSADLRCRIEFAAANDDFSGVALVVRGGRAVFSGAFGYADRESGRQIETDTRFSLASAGKMFTTVAVGQLIESGRLGLDSQLGDLLLDYPNQDARQITVRQLLAHSAGLGAFFDRPGALGATFSTASEAMALFASQPLLFKPGSEARYSNEGYIVLGAIVERLAGTAYYDYVAQNIFQPAGMDNTGFATAADLGVLPTGYAFADDDLFGLGVRRPVPRSLIGRGYAGGPAGGAYSTADDMSAFMRALTEGRLLQRSTLEALLEVRPGAAEGHALGFQVKSVNGLTLFGHNGGSTAGAEVNIFAVWETGDSYVLMSNYAPPIGQPLSDDVASMLSVKVDE